MILVYKKQKQPTWCKEYIIGLLNFYKPMTFISYCKTAIVINQAPTEVKVDAS